MPFLLTVGDKSLERHFMCLCLAENAECNFFFFHFCFCFVLFFSFMWNEWTLILSPYRSPQVVSVGTAVSEHSSSLICYLVNTERTWYSSTITSWLLLSFLSFIPCSNLKTVVLRITVYCQESFYLHYLSVSKSEFCFYCCTMLQLMYLTQLHLC